MLTDTKPAARHTLAVVILDYIDHPLWKPSWLDWVNDQNKELLRPFLSGSRQGIRAQRSYSVPTPRTESIKLTVEYLSDGEVSGFPTRRRGCHAPAISANEEDSA
jgi:hypothetical protein